MYQYKFLQHSEEPLHTSVFERDPIKLPLNMSILNGEWPLNIEDLHEQISRHFIPTPEFTYLLFGTVLYKFCFKCDII